MDNNVPHQILILCQESRLAIGNLKNFPHKILILCYNIRVVKILIQKKGISD